MKILRKIYIKDFLDQYKVVLLKKTDFYDKYYLVNTDIIKKDELYDYDQNTIDTNIAVNTKYIDQLSNNEIDELYDILKTEESYRN